MGRGKTVLLNHDDSFSGFGPPTIRRCYAHTAISAKWAIPNTMHFREALLLEEGPLIWGPFGLATGYQRSIAGFGEYRHA